MKKLFLFFPFLLQIIYAFAQQNKIDSLKDVLQTAKHDTTRLRLYLALGEEYDVKDNLKYGESAMQLVDKLLSQTSNAKERKKLLKQKAFALGLFVVFYEDNKNTSKTLEYQQKQLFIYQEIKDSARIVDLIIQLSYYYGQIGDIYREMECLQKGLSISKEMNYKKGIACFLHEMDHVYDDTSLVLENYNKSLSIYYEIKDTSGAVWVLEKMGNFYSGHNYAKALECFQKAISLNEGKKDKDGLLRAYSGIAEVYEAHNDTENALVYYQKSFSIAKEINDENMGAHILNAIGDIYRQRNDLTKALDYYYKALQISKASENEYNIPWFYTSLARTYLKQKNYKKAKYYSDSTLHMIKKGGWWASNISSWEHLSAQIDSASGDYKSAYGHYQQYIYLRDKLNNEEVRKAAMREKFQNEYDKQKNLAKVEQDKKDAVAAEEKRKQKIIIYSVSVGMVLVLALAFFIFRGYKQKQKANLSLAEKNKIIEEKNKDITDSINYAKRIQQAKLPDRKEIQKSLPNSFVLFKPKDIVSGDFYYFHKTPSPEFIPMKEGERAGERLVFIASADCTGHGVPGAFMSMIGSEKLDDALAHSADTSEILAHLNKGIKTSLKQSDSDGYTRDGMDIALCSVDLENRIVKFAGANRPFWLIRNGKTSIEEIKATKKAIGGLTEDDQHFDSHEIKLQQGDTFYIFSDGYADTFSRQDNKLTTKKFKEILLDIQDKSMPEQEQHLDNFVENWKAGIEQIDDILVIGVRL